jgi:hypothetical protein
MSFFNLKVQKKKSIKPKGIMPHLKLSKKCLWDKEIEKQDENCNSYGLMKI